MTETKEYNIRFTLDDVNEWLGCSDEAGKRVWMGPDNFAQNMTFRATRKALDHFGIYELSKGIPYDSRYGVNKEINYIGWELITNIARELKEPKKIKSKKNARHFNNVQSFMKWVTIAVDRRIISRIREKYFPESEGESDAEKKIDISEKKKKVKIWMQLKSLNEPIKKSSDSSDITITMGDSIENQTFINQENELIIRDMIEKCPKLADKLLTEFLNFLGNEDRLKERLEFLKTISNSNLEKEIGVIFFFENEIKSLSREYRKIAFKKDETLNDSTWNGYNRILRFRWKEFLYKKQNDPRMVHLTECKEWFFEQIQD